MSVNFQSETKECLLVAWCNMLNTVKTYSLGPTASALEFITPTYLLAFSFSLPVSCRCASIGLCISNICALYAHTFSATNCSIKPIATRIYCELYTGQKKHMCLFNSGISRKYIFDGMYYGYNCRCSDIHIWN